MSLSILHLLEERDATTMVHPLFVIICILSWKNIYAGDEKIAAQKDVAILNLESLKEVANASPGQRKISHCLLQLDKTNCVYNLTALTLPCPILRVAEHLFPTFDLTRLSGGFINVEQSLISIKFSFEKSGGGCDPEQGTVEVNINSTGKHIRVIDQTYLPLKVVLLRTTWELHLKTLRSVDLEINGIFISDNLNGFSKIPTYEGVIIEMRKPKGLTIYELKTTKSQTIQLKHLLEDFNLKTDDLSSTLSLKTKSELTLKKIAFTDASLVGYIEPNIMFELELTGRHSGSLAFGNAHEVFVVVQKYQMQLQPSVAIFGKFNIPGKLDIEILKLASVSEVPSFTFMRYIKEYALAVASDRFSVINIKRARETSDAFSCAECKARFLPGLNVIFNVPDVLGFLKKLNVTRASKKTTVVRPLQSPKITKVDTVYHRNNVISSKEKYHYWKPLHAKSELHTVVAKPKVVSSFAKSKTNSARRSKLVYYMQNLKRSGITRRKLHKHKHKRRHRRDELKDILNSISAGNSTDNETITIPDFDDSFMLDTLSPTPLNTSSHLMPASDTNKESHNITTTSLKNITSVLPNKTSTAQFNTFTALLLSQNKTATNTSSLLSSVLSTNGTATLSKNNTLLLNVTNSTTTNAPSLNSLTSLAANKTFFDTLDGSNSFSLHDISSLTTEYPETQSKVAIPSSTVKFKSNIGKIVVFSSIQEKSVKFILPQYTEAELDDIKRFILTSLEGKGKCNPFNGSLTKFSVDSIKVTDAGMQINLNTSKAKTLVPNLLVLNKYMGVTITVDKDTDGKFDYDNLVFSGEGRQRVFEEEMPVKLVQVSSECSIVGQLHLSTLQNISKKFNAELLSPELMKAFPYIGKVSVMSLSISTRLGGEKAIRLNGRVYSTTKSIVEVDGIISSGDSGNTRKMVLAMKSKNIALESLLQYVYGKNLLVHPWLVLDEAVIVLSSTNRTLSMFDNELMKEAAKQTGVSFAGKLSRPTLCETHFSTDKFCQYFHSKLAATSGMILKGVITKDNFTFVGSASASVSISQEIKMVNPVVTIQYEDGKIDLFVTGGVLISVRGTDIKVKGRISRHGSGFVMLQIASSSGEKLLQNSLIQFKPLLGIAQLSKREDFAGVIELHPSRIGIGSQRNDKVIHIINPSGRVMPSDLSKNFIHGVIKDLSVQGIFDAFGLESKLRLLPFLQDAKFVGISKVVYSEAEREQNFEFIKIPVPPGLTIYGKLKIGADTVRTTVKLNDHEGITWTMEWPALDMSKGLVRIRKNKEETSTGPTLTLSSSLNVNKSLSVTVKAYVSAIGMEKEGVQINVERKNDNILYMFTMKGRMFNELNMVVLYRGSEQSDNGFLMKGHCPSIGNLKTPIKRNLRKVFNDFLILYSKERKENEKATKDVDSLIQELGNTIEMNVKGKLKDLIIQLEDVEESIKEYITGIDDICVEECSRKPVEIQTLQELDINDVQLKNLRMQRIAPKWAMNVSCIAVCEVEKGISYKKAAEKLSVARNLYPLYQKQKRHSQKLDGFLKVAQKIKDTATKAQAFFLKHSEKAKKVVQRFMRDSIQANWFELQDLSIPEININSLKGKLPCLPTKLKFSLYGNVKEITKETCINGEVLENIGKNIFYTVFPKSELISLTQHFDKVKSFYARIRQRREELVNVIRHDEQDDDMEASKLEEMSKRDEIFNPLVKQVSKEEDPYDKRFKKLVMQHVPQYTVHSYKTSVVMNQKSPWAVLKRKQSKRTSLARKQRSVLNTTTPSEGDECGALNGVAAKYSHITNALADLVEAYNNGKAAFAETRDDLVDSLHALDSKITNEANRTYYTKGELKDMIYWSVRVWKGVEDWVQESTRQFEDHNRNALSQFTEQLNSALTSQHTTTAADYVQRLSHIGSSAMKKMAISPSARIVKKTFPLQSEDYVQNVALALSGFLTNKDMTLDDATSRIPILRSAVHILESKLPPCEAQAIDLSSSATDVTRQTAVPVTDTVQPVTMTAMSDATQPATVIDTSQPASVDATQGLSVETSQVGTVTTDTQPTIVETVPSGVNTDPQTVT